MRTITPVCAIQMDEAQMRTTTIIISTWIYPARLPTGMHDFDVERLS